MKKEKILIIGSGAREHAIGYKLFSSSTQLYFAPGNPGTAHIGENISIQETEIKKLAIWAKNNKIDFTIVGPDAPIAQGIADVFQKLHLPIFAPSRKAARLESSKIYAAKFLEKYHIPYPHSLSFTDFDKAIAYIKNKNPKDLVIKADGLALGKGVILPTTMNEARQAIFDMMQEKKFGESGKRIVIQEKLIGQEVSLLAFSDGKTIVPLTPAQDHKRIFDNDKGPNTGGMGTYAPVRFVTKKLLQEIQQKILQPTINGMRKEKAPFKGLLFTGLMITQKGPMVLEYNVRFGDPETQSVLLLLKSNLLKIMKACVEGKLKKSYVQRKKGSAIAVVLASKGYPSTPQKEIKIYGLESIKDQNIHIFHAATTEKNGGILTNGGRVLSVCAYALTLQKAAEKAYAYIGKGKVYFAGMQCRKDIAIEHML